MHRIKPTDKLFYVYALLDSTKPSSENGAYDYGNHTKFSHEPFYIGYGSGSRIKAHVQQALHHKGGKYADNGHKARRIRKILRNGGKVIELRSGNLGTKAQAEDREEELILEIGRADLNEGPLCNHTDGRQGGVGYRHTKATKEFLRQLKLGVPNSEEANRKISDNSKAYLTKGIPRPHYVKKKISRKLTGKPGTGRNAKGHKKSKETIEKIRAAKLGKPSGAKGVPKTGRGAKGHTKAPSTRLKMSLASSGVPKTGKAAKGVPKSAEHNRKNKEAQLLRSAFEATLPKMKCPYCGLLGSGANAYFAIKRHISKCGK